MDIWAMFYEAMRRCSACLDEAELGKIVRTAVRFRQAKSRRRKIKQLKQKVAQAYPPMRKTVYRAGRLSGNIIARKI